jgi:hypothetical protein
MSLTGVNQKNPVDPDFSKLLGLKMIGALALPFL